MKRSVLAQISLFVAIIAWATVLGGIAYSNLVNIPPYLSHLPESNKLITGPYGIKDQNFWTLVHPVAVLITIVALALNWKNKSRRKYMVITLGIYVVALVATATYFIP